MHGLPSLINRSQQLMIDSESYKPANLCTLVVVDIDGTTWKEGGEDIGHRRAGRPQCFAHLLPQRRSIFPFMAVASLTHDDRYLHRRADFSQRSSENPWQPA